MNLNEITDVIKKIKDFDQRLYLLSVAAEKIPVERTFCTIHVHPQLKGQEVPIPSEFILEVMQKATDYYLVEKQKLEAELRKLVAE